MTSDLKVGKRTYRIGDVLGSGGFSDVVKAIDMNSSSKKSVAIKIMKNIKEDAKQVRRQVQKEILSMRELKHQNILALLGYDMDTVYKGEKAICLVLEIAPNGELFDYLIEQKKFDPDLAVGIFSQLLDGLQHAHGKGIAHRDLKPENLLLDKKYRLKIADWGFSYIYDKGAGKQLLRTELGTRGYMAPEILNQTKYDGELTDVFAAGVILFICLAGFPPFQNASKDDWWFDKLMKKKYKLFWMAHERTAKFSKEAKKLIQDMLAPNPKERARLADVRKSSFFVKNSGMNMKAVSEKFKNISSKFANNMNDKGKTSRAVGGLVKYCENLRPGEVLTMSAALKNTFQEQSTKGEIDSKLLEKLNDRVRTPFLDAVKTRKTEFTALFKDVEYGVTPQQVAEALAVKPEEKWVEPITRGIINFADLLGDIFGEQESITEKEITRLTKHYDKCKTLDQVDNLRDFKDVAQNTLHAFEFYGSMGVVYHAVAEDYLKGVEAHLAANEVHQFQQANGQILFSKVVQEEITVPDEDNPEDMLEATMEVEMAMRVELLKQGNKNILYFRKMDTHFTTKKHFETAVQAIMASPIIHSATRFKTVSIYEEQTEEENQESKK